MAFSNFWRASGAIWSSNYSTFINVSVKDSWQYFLILLCLSVHRSQRLYLWPMEPSQHRRRLFTTGKYSCGIWLLNILCKRKRLCTNQSFNLFQNLNTGLLVTTSVFFHEPLCCDRNYDEKAVLYSSSARLHWQVIWTFRWLLQLLNLYLILRMLGNFRIWISGKLPRDFTIESLLVQC